MTVKWLTFMSLCNSKLGYQGQSLGREDSEARERACTAGDLPAEASYRLCRPFLPPCTRPPEPHRGYSEGLQPTPQRGKKKKTTKKAHQIVYQNSNIPCQKLVSSSSNCWGYAFNSKAQLCLLTFMITRGNSKSLDCQIMRPGKWLKLCASVGTTTGWFLAFTR